MSSLHILANPNARSGRGARVIPALLRALEARDGVRPPLQITAAPGHARELAAHLARSTADGEPPASGSGARPSVILLVVGGDGTLHEAVNGLRDAGFPRHVALAVLPVGTGNDFHRMLRGRGGVEGAMEVLSSGTVRHLDVGRVRWEGGEAGFVNLLGVGIDVEVLRRRERFQRLPGLLQYGGALLSALRTFRPVPLRIQAAGPGEGEAASALPARTPSLLAALTVGPSIGGGFLLSPEALPDDGALDLFLAQPLSFLQVLRHLPGVVRGTLTTTDRIHRARVLTARLEADDDIPFRFELDGEPMPDPTRWLEVDVLPGALALLDLPPIGPAAVGSGPAPPPTAGSRPIPSERLSSP